MPRIEAPPFRRGSKKTTDIKVGILNGNPALQVNWGGRIYGAQLYLAGAGNVKEDLDVGNIRATGNITFSKNSFVYNNSNRVIMSGGLTGSADGNMAIGNDKVLSSLVSGADSNIGIGVNAGEKITNADGNTCIGHQAGNGITTTSSNVIVGTLASSTTNGSLDGGNLNVIIGFKAGYLGTTARTKTKSVCIGSEAGSASAGTDNIFIGTSTGNAADSDNNIVIGDEAGDAGLTGDDNLLIGRSAGTEVIAGANNICLGSLAGDAIISGSNNICIGYSADVNAEDAVNRVLISPTAATVDADNTTLFKNTNFIFDFGGATNTLKYVYDGSNYTTLDVASTGALEIATTSGGSNAHITFVADGHVEFDGCGVGFDLEEPTYDSTITVVDFRKGNKQLVTFDGDNIATLSMVFPATSGNFVVLVKQDGTGSRTITNYRTCDVDGTNVDAVRFPGASNPDLTDDANFVDIISVFWDADNFLAYGVATLNFDPS